MMIIPLVVRIVASTDAVPMHANRPFRSTDEDFIGHRRLVIRSCDSIGLRAVPLSPVHRSNERQPVRTTVDDPWVRFLPHRWSPLTDDALADFRCISTGLTVADCHRDRKSPIQLVVGIAVWHGVLVLIG